MISLPHILSLWPFSRRGCTIYFDADRLQDLGTRVLSVILIPCVTQRHNFTVWLVYLSGAVSNRETENPVLSPSLGLWWNTKSMEHTFVTDIWYSMSWIIYNVWRYNLHQKHLQWSKDIRSLPNHRVHTFTVRNGQHTNSTAEAPPFPREHVKLSDARENPV